MSGWTITVDLCNDHGYHPDRHIPLSSCVACELYRTRRWAEAWKREAKMLRKDAHAQRLANAWRPR